MPQRKRPKLTIRYAQSKDLPNVVRFYSENPSANIADRDYEILLDAIEQQKLLLVEDGHGNHRKIVGACSVFHWMGSRYREIGATRVVLNGYKLQQVMTLIRVLNEELTDPDWTEIFGICRPTAAASLHNLKAIGFEDWSPDKYLKSHVTIVAGRDRFTGNNVVCCPMGALPSMAAYLLRIVDKRKLSGRNGEADIEIDVYIIKKMRREVEELAGSEFETTP